MDRLRNQKGFSLVEVMVASVVLAVAILSASLSILHIQNLSEVSRQKVVAVADANRVLEAIRDRANQSFPPLTTAQNQPWTLWATNNIVLPRGVPGSNEIRLSQENVTVNFSGTDPVQVTLTVNWIHRQRPYNYQVITRMTRRS